MKSGRTNPIIMGDEVFFQDSFDERVFIGKNMDDAYFTTLLASIGERENKAALKTQAEAARKAKADVEEKKRRDSRESSELKAFIFYEMEFAAINKNYGKIIKMLFMHETTSTIVINRLNSIYFKETFKACHDQIVYILSTAHDKLSKATNAYIEHLENETSSPSHNILLEGKKEEAKLMSAFLTLPKSTDKKVGIATYRDSLKNAVDYAKEINLVKNLKQERHHTANNLLLALTVVSCLLIVGIIPTAIAMLKSKSERGMFRFWDAKATEGSKVLFQAEKAASSLGISDDSETKRAVTPRSGK